MTCSINRRKWDGAELERLIDLPFTECGQMFPECIRRGIKAYQPDASQWVVDMPQGVFALERISLDATQRIFATHNMTGQPLILEMSSLGERTASWFDALHQVMPDIDEEGLRLRPYQALWLMPKT